MSLVHHWKMNGNSNDVIGGNNGTDTNVSYLGADPSAGSRALFGSNNSSYIDLESNTQLQQYTNFSVSLWYNNANGNSGVYQLLSEGNNSQNLSNIQYGLENGKLFLFIRDSGGTYDLDYSTAAGHGDGLWHHLVWVDTNGSYTIYKDLATTGLNGSYTRRNIGTNQAAIGVNRRTSYEQSFNGYEDDIRIYNHSLSADERRTIFNDYRNPLRISLGAQL